MVHLKPFKCFVWLQDSTPSQYQLLECISLSILKEATLNCNPLDLFAHLALIDTCFVAILSYDYHIHLYLPWSAESCLFTQRLRPH